MPYTPEIIEELRILSMYRLDSTQEGLKVHSTADPNLIEATKRLYDKGLVSQEDGGYLTNLGRTATEHALDLLTILQANDES